MHLRGVIANRAVFVVKHTVKDRIGEFHGRKGGEERLDAAGTKESAKMLLRSVRLECIQTFPQRVSDRVQVERLFHDTGTPIHTLIPFLK